MGPNVRSGVRVFVSYAHEPIDDHRERVLELTESLRLRGIEAVVDQYVEHDPPLWPQWMMHQVRDSDFVLCVVSPAYRERADGDGDRSSGRGVRWEGAIITEELYSSLIEGNRKFIAIVLDGYSRDDIPLLLQPFGRSSYSWPSDDELLYRRLTNQPTTTPAELGAIVILD